MAQTVRHRGPDGVNAWLSPSGRCALGHTRLSVIDLELGDQPMANEDGSVQVVFNGEIYNHRALRTELERAGHRFRTESDTEVLAHGYEQWGINVVERLEGMFAFGIWDEQATRLIVARDRAGKKPLFVSRRGDTFVFGSEMKALLAHPRFEAAVDEEAIPLYLSYGYVPGSRTVYKDVRKFPPATVATLDGDGRWREKRYWEATFRPEPIRADVAVAQVRVLLENAVSRRLESDVPLGAFLSGGLDSTVVVGLMSRMSDQPVRTFSIGFEGQPSFDETRFAREASEAFGTCHTEFRIGPQSIDLVDRLVDHYDEPFGDSSGIPTYIVSKMAREHVTVALTGDGGDELFAGYLRFQGARLAEALPDWGARFGGIAARAIPHHADFRSPQRRARRFLLAASASPEERLLTWVGYLGHALEDVLPASIQSPGREIVLESLTAAFARADHSASTSLSRALSVNWDTYLPEDLMVKADRCSMAHALELRSPFLDTELVQYAARLPDRLKVRGRTLKWVLKEAVRDLVPGSIRSRAKMGFGMPLAEWLRGPWRPLLEERILVSGALISEWVRPELVQSMARDHLSGRADFAHPLWALLTLDAWMRRHRSASDGLGKGSYDA